jgi:hypothetical protein
MHDAAAVATGSEVIADGVAEDQVEQATSTKTIDGLSNASLGPGKMRWRYRLKYVEGFIS